MAKVSVAIATYNQREYLREAIESVLAQQYPNLEIAVADDGSHDGTAALLREYDQRYPGLFKLALGERNLGITGNHNRVLPLCSGKYIAWLGGDDLMLPGRLQQQTTFLEANPEYAACFHEMDFFESSTGRSLRCFSDGYPMEEFHRNPLRTMVRYGFADGPSAMVRRSMSPDSFDERVPIASDWLYYVEVARAGAVKFFPEVYTRYRRHSGNSTMDYRTLVADTFATLAILDEKFPELRKDVQFARARVLYAQGIFEVQAKDWRAGREHLRESVRHAWLGWKWVAWYGRAVLER